jgi:methane/ammonia monooxygenase subunit B
MKTKIVMSLFAVVVAFVALASYVPTASAHGERSQEPFLRMRSLQWYDTKWSTDSLAVNGEFILTGKFHVFEDWPSVLEPPEVAFMNIAVPSPVLTREGSWINGVNMVNSTKLQIGGDYEYKIVMRGRHPGRWHLHPMVNVLRAGPIVGPGNWVTVTGSNDDFTNPEVTLTGEEIDLEYYGVANVVRWHIIWAIPAVFWLLWWLRRPLFIPRRKMVEDGNAEDQLVTPLDRKIGVVLLVGTLLLTLWGHLDANKKNPITIPLQTGLATTPPLVLPDAVDAKVVRATYRIPGRAMKMTLEITNKGSTPLKLGEFESATVRFINKGVGEVDPKYPDYLMAENGLQVEPSGPIFPGETKTVKVVAADAAWETERLSSLIHDPDSRFGGQLFFYDPAGNRFIERIGAPLIPAFR